MRQFSFVCVLALALAACGDDTVFFFNSDAAGGDTSGEGSGGADAAADTGGPSLDVGVPDRDGGVEPDADAADDVGRPDVPVGRDTDPPDVGEPDVFEPEDVFEPDAEPDVFEPDAEPDVGEPDVFEPDVVEDIVEDVPEDTGPEFPPECLPRTAPFCVNACDRSVLGSPAFNDTLIGCDSRCGASRDPATCIRDCVAEGGLTPGCSACFGGYTGCMIDRCTGPCERSPEDCDACRDDQCIPELSRCSGIAIAPP